MPLVKTGLEGEIDIAVSQETSTRRVPQEVGNPNDFDALVFSEPEQVFVACHDAVRSSVYCALDYPIIRLTQRLRHNAFFLRLHVPIRLGEIGLLLPRSW